MGLPTPGTNNLQVLRAVEDGWHAFCRAPWAFLLFQALVLVVMAPFAALLVAGAVAVAAFALPLKLNILLSIAVAVGVCLLLEAWWPPDEDEKAV